ncbi:MAG: hypothetical protein ACI9F9_001861 [Candidatus Paceibacteria bacterium]|jgi:hypothetical protein
MFRFRTSHLRGAALSFLTLLVAGSAIIGCRAIDHRKTLASAVRSTIREPERQSDIQAILNERDARQDKFLAEIAKSQLELRDTIADVNPHPDRVHELFDKSEASFEGFHHEMIDSFLQLKEKLSAEEWAALSGADIDAILSRAVLPTTL